MLIALLIPLVLVTLLFSFAVLRNVWAQRALPAPEALIVGAVANFFDTLGIGSFAPTMAWFKFRRLVPDRLIPSTMLVGYTPPSMAQAIIFLLLLGVFVDPVLLVGCSIALVTGGLTGAGLVRRARASVVQAVVAVALLVAAAFYVVTNLDMMPGGGTATSLPLPLMLVAIAANFGFGLLLNFGVGNYAPTLIMFSLMGMDPRLSFPIMAAGASFAGAAAGARHLSIGQMDMRIVGGLVIGGIPAVLVAAFLVKNMPITTLRWLVFVVVLYAAAVMIRAALSSRREERLLTPEAILAA